jgi:hypothetical protein
VVGLNVRLDTATISAPSRTATSCSLLSQPSKFAYPTISQATRGSSADNTAARPGHIVSGATSALEAHHRADLH